MQERYILSDLDKQIITAINKGELEDKELESEELQFNIKDRN